MNTGQCFEHQLAVDYSCEILGDSLHFSEPQYFPLMWEYVRMDISKYANITIYFYSCHLESFVHILPQGIYNPVYVLIILTCSYLSVDDYWF